MNSRLSLGIAAVICSALVLAQTGDKQPPKCKLQIANGTQSREVILVTLYSQGTAQRSTEFKSEVPITWSDLDPGPYEVYFESRGHGKTIKRITLSPDLATNLSLDKLAEKDELWGAGPTLSDLEKRVAALERK